jgi:hypothetical protein
MGTPSNALQAAIYARLTSFAGITGLNPAPSVYDYVPQGAQPPYILIGDNTALDWGTKTNDGWDMTVTIHVWDYEKQGRKSVNQIMSAIYDALHRQEANITVTGFSLIQIRCEFEHPFQDTTEVGQNDSFYHGVQRYRALVQTN